MEDFFYMLAGKKLVEEPALVLSILREYIMNPAEGPNFAVTAGLKQFYGQ